MKFCQKNEGGHYKMKTVSYQIEYYFQGTKLEKSNRDAEDFQFILEEGFKKGRWGRKSGSDLIMK